MIRFVAILWALPTLHTILIVESDFEFSHLLSNANHTTLEVTCRSYMRFRVKILVLFK